jgi:hypothetical protein
MPNEADAPNPAMTLVFHVGFHWRGIGDLRRYGTHCRLAN